MSDFLKLMSNASSERLSAARANTPRPEMRRAAESMPPARKIAFSEQMDVIAEIKRSAPSSGVLQSDVSITERVHQYEAGGAVAISVLTEPSRFNGELADLREAASVSQLPVMRKDFLTDPYQVFEARANGADGVLLIAAILDDEVLAEMHSIASYLGMFALVEAFDERDIERAQQAGASIVGVNCRNLRDLSVEFERFEKLRSMIDADRQAVAESGITTAEEFSRVREFGYDAALIGSALMRSKDPTAELLALRGSVGADK